MPRAAVRLRGGPGVCNAFRMSLLNDTTALAACKVSFDVNSSSFNNEFLAHRIGMVPFRRTEAEGDTLRLVVQGPARVHARDLSGIGVEAVHGGVLIAALGTAEQRIEATVYFDERKGGEHARYMPVCAVGMRPHGPDRHEVSFEVIDPQRSARAVAQEALRSLEERVDRALRALADQPADPPRSCC